MGLFSVAPSCNTSSTLSCCPKWAFSKILLPVSRLGQVGEVCQRELLAFCLVPVAGVELRTCVYALAQEVPVEARGGIASPELKFQATASH